MAVGHFSTAHPGKKSRMGLMWMALWAFAARTVISSAPYREPVWELRVLKRPTGPDLLEELAPYIGDIRNGIAFMGAS